MSDLYEQLKASLSGGFNTMALMDAPYAVRKIVNLMLRKRGRMTYQELLDAMNQVSEEKRPGQEEIDETLDVLCRLGWLRKVEEDNQPTPIYEINTGG